MKHLITNLDQLRRKLIDLSNRNPLIKYNLAARNPRYIDIVNQSIDHIWTLILSNEDLYLRFLPESKIISSDKNKEAPSPQDIAKEYGINSSLELPLQEPERTLSKNLQTMLPFNRFHRLISNLHETTRLSSEEKGINSLYCIFGFLEWLEIPNSETFLTSPLLLMPIELEAFKTKSIQEGVRLRGEEIDLDSKIVNPSLRLKLKQDFGFDLPEWQELDTPRTYFERVEAILKVYPKWRIVPRVLIGNFTFPKMALYDDLEISKWGDEANNQLLNNPIIKQLLGGLERVSGNELLKDTEEDAIGKPIKGLVFNADSSQLEAIRRIAKGETMVLEGPPGTGKSQTIANLISVAISQGKTVLFVADKTAAIDVVEQRLTKAGLSAFCLNLHDGSRVGKEHMYKRLEERLHLGIKSSLPATQNKVQFDNSLCEKLSKTTSKLDSYFFQLAHSPDSSHQSMADILWSSIGLRHEFNELPGLIRKLKIPKALSLSTEQKAEINDTLIEIEQQMAQIDPELKGLIHHPLFGLQLTDPSVFKKEQIVDLLTTTRETGAQLLTLVTQLALLELIKDQKFSSLETLPLLIETYKLDTDYTLQQALFANTNVDHLTKTLTCLTDYCPTLRTNLLNEDTLKILDYSILTLSTFLQLQSKDCMLKEEIVKTKEEVKDFLCKLANVRTVLSKILPHDLLEKQYNWVNFLKNFAEFLERMQKQEESVKKRMIPALWNQVPKGHWKAIHQKTQAAKYEYQELKLIFSPEVFHAYELIEELAKSLKKNSSLCYFKPAWWESRAELNRFCISKIYVKHKDQLEQLERLRCWQQSIKEICTDSNLIALVGSIEDPFSIDFDSIARAQDLLNDMLNSIPEFIKIVQNQELSAEHVLLPASEILGWEAHLVLIQLAKNIESLYQADTFALIEKQALNREKITNETLESITKLGLSSVISENILAILSSLLGSLEQCVAEDKVLSAYSIEKICEELKVFCESQKSASSEIISVFIKRLSHFNTSEKEQLKTTISTLSHLLTDFKKVWQSLKDAAEIDERLLLGNSLLSTEIRVVMNRLSILDQASDKLSEWSKMQKILKSLLHNDCPAQDLVDNYIKENRSFDGISHSFSVLLAQSRAREAFSGHSLAELYGIDIQSLRKRLEREDTKWKENSVRYVQAMALSQSIYPGTSLGPRREWTGLELINNELSKSKRRISQRQLIARAGKSLLSLAPCFMMSPITVAQYLTPHANLKFDLVLIDEASQMRPEEALSAILRGTQLVVVGDSQQLPPTQFYSSIAEDDEVSDEDAIDNESILDMAKATFNSHYLRWHYRSRHDSLIHFSNANFYNERLIICPSPRTISASAGLHLTFAGGTYKDSINNQEAQQVVAKAIELLRSQPDMSIGIVAINREQRELISSLLYEERCRNQELDSQLDAWEEKGERCFVKNLENVQGDERDIILISTVYGPAQVGGPVLRHFGPINGSVGHRRLNVLFTRARDSMHVFTSLKPADVCPPDTASPSRGAQALAQFLEFAASGIKACSNKSAYRQDPDSPFEQYVGDLIERSGYEVEYQVGQSGFRIDLGIKHPSFPYGFIAGIECDGAAYHSSKSARDRDRLRQDILEEHGWRIYRIWSTDWFNDPRNEGQKLVKWLDHQRIELTQQIKTLSLKDSEMIQS